MTATETLLKIIELTNKNLEILGLINESFFTNKEHLTTLIDGTRYTIPSFISLENKVNHLQAAFNNLVHSPMTGEAYMNFDGNSRVIQMRGFQQGPAQVDLDKQYDLASLKQFFTEDSNLFKDMLSPKPYIKLDLSELEDDITQVVVKKIVPYSASLMQLMLDAGASDTISAIDYGVMRALLDSGNIFKKGTDYAEYETVYTLPIRKLTCFGEYTVEEIKSDIVDDKLNNIITVQLAEPTVCTIYDGFTTRNLRAGDILTTYDGSARLEIIGLTQSTRTLELKVLSGEYLNILPNAKSVDDKVSDYSKLRFYKPEDFNSDKYLNIPLEEDPYVYITVAPLNSRMNTQANWGTGLYIKVDELTDAEGTPFRDYYKQNVKNIGDTINELAAILPAPLTNLDSVEFDALREAKPYLTNTDDVIDTLQVVQINKHLNEAENIQTIRNLYSQKQQYKVDLTECQNKIATLTSELSEISFDDMSGSRTMISAQIDDLKARQNELIASINTATDAISLAANDTEVPIEDGKYRIRGYVDIDRFVELNHLEEYKDHIRAVKVRYRYKNPGISELANVSTIGDFLFTEWNNYSAGIRHKTASYSNGVYTTSFDEPEMSDNDVKFNQVDIPITQGEQVDVQAKIIWDYGYPFVNIESDWSDAVTIEFPQELAADVQVTTILKENNDDIETYRFENILTNHGITQHSNDYIDDQNIRYFHKPESISSGFYTEERRVIPLADKLKAMNTQLASIQDMLLGTHAESLRVSLTVNNIEYELKPDINNVVQLSAYNVVPIISASEELQTDLVRTSNSTAATTFGSITIKNVTDHTLRLFSMVPGARNNDMVSSTRFGRVLNVGPNYAYAEPIPTSTVTPQSSNPNEPSDSGPTGYDNPNSNTLDANEGGDDPTGTNDSAQNVLNDGAGGGNGSSTVDWPFTINNGDGYNNSQTIINDTSGAVNPLGKMWNIQFTKSNCKVKAIQIVKEKGSDEGKRSQVAPHRPGGEETYPTVRNVTLNVSGHDNFVYSSLSSAESISSAISGGNADSRGWQLNPWTGAGLAPEIMDEVYSSSSTIQLRICKYNKSEDFSGTKTSYVRFIVNVGGYDYIKYIEFKTQGPQAPSSTTSPTEPTIGLTVDMDEIVFPGTSLGVVQSIPLSVVCTGLSGGNIVDGSTEWGKLSVSTSSSAFTATFDSATSTSTQKTVKNAQQGSVFNNIIVQFKPTAQSNYSADLTITWEAEHLLDGTTPVQRTKTKKVKLRGTCFATSIDGNTFITGIYSSSELEDFTGAKMVYILDPSNVDMRNGILSAVNGETQEERDAQTKALKDAIFNGQRQNQFVAFRIREPYGDERLGDQTQTEELVVNQITNKSKNLLKAQGVAYLEDQQNLMVKISADEEFENSFVYATPATGNVEADLCIQSDAVQSYMEIGPGDSKTIPVFIAYFMNPDSPNSSYVLGFDIRNSLYNDPLYYQVTLAARYNQTYADLLQSQKASVSNQINYNPVIRS